MAHKHPGWWAFLSLMAIFLLVYGGHYVNGDNAYRLAWAKAILDGGRHDVSLYMNVEGPAYSKYGIGHTLLHVPLIAASRAITKLTGLSCESPVNMILYPLNASIACALMVQIWVGYGLTGGAAWRRAMLVGLATVWFAYTKLEYSESLTATALLAMWLWLPSRPWLSGLVGGLAISVRMDSALWAAWTLIVSPGGRSSKLRCTLGIVPGVVLTLWSNWIRTGSILKAGYEREAFSYPTWAGAYGLLLSSGKSVFLFTPLLLLGWWGLKSAGRDPERRRIAIWAGGYFLGQVLFYGSWWDPTGDDSWGPRFLIGSTLAMLVVVLMEFDLNSRLVWVTAAAGLIVNVPGVLIGPHTSLMAQHLLKPTKVDLFLSTRSPIDVDDSRFLPRYSQVVASWELLVYKISGRVPRSTEPTSTGTTWLEGFAEPPLVDWDVMWLNFAKYRRVRNEIGTVLPAQPQVESSGFVPGRQDGRR